MADTEIKLIIKADGTAAISGIREVEGAAESLGGSWKKAAVVAAATTAAVLALHKGIEQVKESALLAARVETMGVVLNVVGRNAGYSSEQMSGFVDSVKKMGITTSAAEESVTRMAQAQMSLANSSQLARVAQDAAVIGNMNSSQAFETLVYGIQSAQVRVLRTIGINVDFEASYNKLAKQIGKTSDALTEQEKIQARMNVVLEAGERISGVYSAAMGTVGKQALSLARYSEEASLKLGELFKPSYGVLVNIATDSLKTLNDRLAEMSRNGDLKKWGDAGADTLIFLANNAVPIAVGGLTTLGIAVSGLTAKFSLLAAMSKLAMSSTGIGIAITSAAIAGNELGQYLESTKPDNRQFAALLQDTKEEQEFLTAKWKNIQKQLDTSGIKGIQSPLALSKAMEAGDIVKYQVKTGQAVDYDTGQVTDIVETRFKDVRNELQKTKAQIDATTKGFAAMASTIAEAGGMALQFASDDLRKKIALQADDLRQLTVGYQNLSDTIKSGYELDRQITKVGDLTGAFAVYGGTIEDVYTKQLEVQREILDEMKNYETKQSAISKQAANVTETEIKYNEAKLANYRSYYDELKKLQKGYFDSAVKATQDIAKIEKDMMANRKQTAGLQYDIWSKANPANNEMEQYYRDAAKLDQQLTVAMTLSGEEKIKALQDVQKQWSSLGKEITTSETERQLVIGGPWESSEFKDVTITKTVQTFDDAYKRVTAIGEAIAQTQQQMRQDSESNRDKAIAAYASLINPIKAAEAAIYDTQAAVVTLDDRLAQQRILSIDVSGAMSGLQMVIDSLTQVNNLSSQLTGRSRRSSGGSGSSPGSSYLVSPGDNGSGSAWTSNYVGNTAAGEYYRQTTPKDIYTDSYANSYGTGAYGSTPNTPGEYGVGAYEVIQYDYEPSYEPSYYDEYAEGTDYVPRTGVYKLHQGEKVIPAEQNKPGSITVQFGDIVITGTDKDPRQLAREIVIPVRDELRKLGYMQ